METKRHKLNMPSFNFRWLDRCLIMFVSFVIMMVLVMFNIYIDKSQKSQLELVQMMMEQTSENQELQFATFVNEKIELLQTLATYPEIYEMDEEKQKAFIKDHSEGLGFEHIFIVNTDGIGYYVEEGIHRNQKEEQFFSDIMSEEVFVTEPFYTENGTIMTGCVSIYNTQKEKVGVLCGAVKLEEAQHLLEQNEMVLDGKCFIANKDGYYMTSSDPKDLNEPMSVYELPDSDVSLLDRVFETKQNQMGTMILEGVEYQAHLTYLEKYNWILVQSVPTAVIFARYEFMNKLNSLLLVLVVALILSIGRIIYCWKKSDKKIYTDALTKCNSRAACTQLMERLEDCRNKEITIIYMDLNKFKYVNDTYGHEKGDELLCIFSAALMKIFGEVGFVGRMGGDEFVSILVDVSEERIMTLWNVLEQELLEQSKTLDFPYVITSSYGYYIREKNMDTPLEIIMQKADEKMYEYKVAKKVARE